MTDAILPTSGHSADTADMTPTSTALVMFALAMGGFTIGTTEFAAMSLLPYIAEGLGVDEPTSAHAISAYALGVVVGAPIIAVLSARMSRYALLILLTATIGIANGLSALSPGYEALLAFRFLSGLPHGAYFGVAALVAASLVPRNRRTSAVAKVMLGLTVATIVGVPLATWLGQNLGWRWGLGVTALLALVTTALVAIFAPRDEARHDASPIKELGALKRRQVWLTLLTGAIGFGGIFAVYSYTSATLLFVTKVDPRWVPLAIAIFGIGMTLGTIAAAWAADRALKATVIGVMLAGAAALLAFPFATHDPVAVVVVIFLIGCTSSLGTVMQTYLMDVAGEAQTLAAALNHSAFNTANALGPWLAGMAITAGYGFESSGYVGAALSLAGLLIWLVTMADARRRKA